MENAMTKRSSGVPVADIRKIVDYLYHDEEVNFLGEWDHIFRHIKRVAQWLGSLDDHATAA